jgi:predicted small secreted protein
VALSRLRNENERQTMKQIAILATAFVLAACADTPAVGMGDCKSTDWYKLGYRDGSQAGRSELDAYAQHCAGVKPDAAAYNQGLEKGQWEKAHRRF